MKRPVTLVTGFLGSGKTTLVAELLRRPELSETAVIVNELGEVGLDHHLLRRVDERTVLLASGCVCCTLRGDLADELRDLLDRSDAGEIPPFRRVVVETTGVADPTPIVNTLLTDPFVPHHYALDGVVATIDGQHGLRGTESVKQAAAADVLVLTKPDLADGASLDALEARARLAQPHGGRAPGRRSATSTPSCSFGSAGGRCASSRSSQARHTTTPTRSGPSCSSSTASSTGRPSASG